MRVVLAALVAALIVAAPAQAAPRPDEPFVLLYSPTRADLSEMPDGVEDARSLPDQASAMAEAHAKPIVSAATAARKSRRRAVARTAHAGHGCYGQTDNPHWSGHNPGAITVRSRTVCYGHAVGVAVNLYRWIFGAWYFRDGASASGWERVNANATQDNAGCGWWRGEAGHSATNHYPSNTSNQAYLC